MDHLIWNIYYTTRTRDVYLRNPAFDLKHLSETFIWSETFIISWFWLLTWETFHSVELIAFNLIDRRQIAVESLRGANPISELDLASLKIFEPTVPVCLWERTSKTGELEVPRIGRHSQRSWENNIWWVRHCKTERPWVSESVGLHFVPYWILLQASYAFVVSPFLAM